MSPAVGYCCTGAASRLFRPGWPWSCSGAPGNWPQKRGAGGVRSLLRGRHPVDGNWVSGFRSGHPPSRVGSRRRRSSDGGAQNLALLSREGLLRRRQRLEALFSAYGKPSHRDAVESAERLAARLPAVPLPTRVFQADACAPPCPQALELRADIVVTDIPYGRLTPWQGEADDPLPAFAAQIRAAMAPRGPGALRVRRTGPSPLSRMAAAPEAEDREAAVRPVSGGLADTPCNPRPFVLY